MTAKKIYLRSFGCQMNEYDSEKIVDLMVANGYERTEKVDEADLVVLNTCSIREKFVKSLRRKYSLNWDAFAMLRKKPTKTIC